MEIFKDKEDLSKYVAQQKKEGSLIGFIPTMGALHNGHVSLIEQSSAKTDITICSIFVNPTQFNKKEDLVNYPNTLERDFDMLRAADCDAVFLPSVEAMYPKEVESGEVDYGNISKVLEAAHRPGHFDGVIYIVHALLMAVNPTHLFMGQKDYQQYMICAHMIKERSVDAEIVMCPIIREESGLAMSSRNMRLDDASRKDALLLSKTLSFIKNNLGKKPISELISTGKKELNNHPNIDLEYLACCDAENLEDLKVYNPKEDAVVLTAAVVGGIRLIDNVFIAAD